MLARKPNENVVSTKIILYKFCPKLLHCVASIFVKIKDLQIRYLLKEALTFAYKRKLEYAIVVINHDVMMQYFKWGHVRVQRYHKHYHRLCKWI